MFLVKSLVDDAYYTSTVIAGYKAVVSQDSLLDYYLGVSMISNSNIELPMLLGYKLQVKPCNHESDVMTQLINISNDIMTTVMCQLEDFLNTPNQHIFVVDPGTIDLIVDKFITNLK